MATGSSVFSGTFGRRQRYARIDQGPAPARSRSPRQSTYTGTTTLSGGAVNVGAAENPRPPPDRLGNSPAANPGSILFNGGALQYSGANQNDYSGRFSTVDNQAYCVDTNGQSVTWATALTSSGGTLTKTGAGTLTLSGQNTYTGTTTLSAGALNLGAAEDPGVSGPLGNSPAANPGSIVLSGGTLQYSDANQNDYSGRFSTADNQAYRVDTNGQNVTWATALTGSGRARSPRAARARSRSSPQTPIPARPPLTAARSRSATA